MSATLLKRVRDHIFIDGGLLTGFETRYFRWTDADLQGSADIALFRMSGTFGDTVEAVQFNDVSLYAMCDAESMKSTDDAMLAVLQYLRADYSTAGVFGMTPIGTYTGPTALQNGRCIFEMVIRCGTEDH
jgi:hypothetical protein